MKFLLTNDDGIEAPGLEALATAARQLGDAVTVAPAGPQSGVSHAVTWRQGVRIEPRGEHRFAIHGTPADCTRLGLLHLIPNAEWILSGINHGSNLGADMHYSGTVAAVREAVLHGWPGIAVSHFRKGGMEFDWARAAKWLLPILTDLIARPVEPGLFYNVNLPHLTGEDPDPEIVSCPLDPIRFRSTTRTRKEPASTTRATTPCAVAHPGRTWTYVWRPDRRDVRATPVINASPAYMDGESRYFRDHGLQFW